MKKNHSIVLNDKSTLWDFFGVNDENIKFLEEILGMKIFSQGNELSLDSEDAETCRRFKEMLVQLEECVNKGQSLSQSLIRTVYHSISLGEPEKIDFIKQKQVYIPTFTRSVFPRSYNQAVYLDAIDKYELVFGIGPAGTGKTYLAVAQALKAVLTHCKRKLVITRPVVEADESLGYLPGDLEQKIQPYLRPIYDSIETIISLELLKKLLDNKTIEIAPLAYMRGRTFSNCIIILDEAQNTTMKQMLMFLTRIGEDSKAIVTGDITQTDLPGRMKSGLVHAAETLRSIPEISFIHFKKRDIVRSPLVKKIIRAYEEQV